MRQAMPSEEATVTPRGRTEAAPRKEHKYDFQETEDDVQDQLHSKQPCACGSQALHVHKSGTSGLADFITRCVLLQSCCSRHL